MLGSVRVSQQAKHLIWGDRKEDFECVVRDVAESKIKGVVHSQSLDTCASLYAYFPHALQDANYSPGTEHISGNRLFGMFHSCINKHNERVVISSLSETDAVLQVQ